MNDDELQAIFNRAYRKQRRDAKLLILVSALFIVVGLIMLIGAGQIIGLFVSVFFAAGIVAGIMQLVGMHTRPALLLGICAALLLTAACTILIVLTLTGVIVDAPGHSQIVATIAAVVGLVFFGGGSVVLLVRWVRRR
ncbi:hypothetical protein [Brevibacterium marinum]|uniref:Membrane-associated HD superfamily phosphohydrolase n=1 Tax=Brevibacterium marinum TaxID=418643 RepID=A0A846S045_9MICO|nr:hypothetical protein [Brevibacterium marinum]NJC56830.1 membrane-associated HD superfamily phosphohydrolase [Brevibacterium marinum]